MDVCLHSISNKYNGYKMLLLINSKAKISTLQSIISDCGLYQGSTITTTGLASSSNFSRVMFSSLNLSVAINAQKPPDGVVPLRESS
jgi:hypothetical protein